MKINEEAFDIATSNLGGDLSLWWLREQLTATINASNPDDPDQAAGNTMRVVGTYLVHMSRNRHLSALLRGIGESMRDVGAGRHAPTTTQEHGTSHGGKGTPTADMITRRLPE